MKRLFDGHEALKMFKTLRTLKCLYTFRWLKYMLLLEGFTAVQCRACGSSCAGNTLTRVKNNKYLYNHSSKDPQDHFQVWMKASHGVVKLMNKSALHALHFEHALLLIQVIIHYTIHRHISRWRLNIWYKRTQTLQFPSDLYRAPKSCPVPLDPMWKRLYSSQRSKMNTRWSCLSFAMTHMMSVNLKDDFPSKEM